jgi:hypothetical protein
MNSGLHVITAPPLIYTLYKSLHAKSSPDCIVFTSRSLAMASNSGESSASCAQVHSSQPSVQNSLLTDYSKRNYSTISSQPPLQSPSCTDRAENTVSNSNSCCVRIRCRRNMFTDPLPRNGLCLYAYVAIIA